MSTPSVSPAGTVRHPGGCHCGAVRWEFGSDKRLATLSPRACDCDFCTRHRAAWVSDPAGWLRIRARSAMLHRYRQGSEQAEFLLCRDCGVLIAVVARTEEGGLIGAANRNAFDARSQFLDETVVSPRSLAADAKFARWGQVWMPAELTAE